jgi:outer membrane protein assembly factor BamD
MKSAVEPQKKTWSREALALAAIAAAALLLPGCILLHHNRNTDLGANVAPGSQPDKVLFEKAKAEIDGGRYDVGRLTLQTMINTYPDSELLSKAKLLTADSYYKEGGISGLTQAEAEYNDFITFFPTAPEAPEAKYRAGMSHYRLMAKPDRDLSEAKAAQVEFKEFLDKYPDNPLAPVVKGKLREVQEVLAEGDYETAVLYFRRGVNRAAASRFKEIADSYPDFSQADQALWYLGQADERLRKPAEAASAYGHILTDYPLSLQAKPAKDRLVAMHKPVPKATKATLARARADRMNATRVHTSLMAKAKGELTGAPDVSATRHGPVRLGPPPAGGVEAAQGQSGTANSQIAVQPLSDGSSPAAASASPPAANPPETTPAAGPPATNPSPTAPPATTPPTTDSAPSSAAPPEGDTAAASPGNHTAKDAPAAKTSSSTSSSSSSDSDPKQTSSTKKKGKFHFLKKIVP